ncbi:Thiol-disulfide isomerase or thioredoxin [Chitinophaga ginsengisegetis]|uniref:Thiol-disulfide isomerase or thioredoxin n=1 Tax=Chitinophaga ginsengisegetis TaxID=393003 RepID=A0A1T5N5C8_9BACT|nr:TlpA disulfide reductase family protein [Chitinophaga ginsengisegetis]SKC95682.1 Thiol-disulfide isomerase or thioredoxin [Chitinophaga ginsengisegetis]
MKKILLTGVVIIALAQILSAQKLYSFLDNGEPVNKYPAVTWLKESGITKFEQDKIYVIELWATWCKPCIKSMPHMSELATKFKGKITFISQGVWESDTAKVRQFITDHAAFFTNSMVAFDGGKDKADFDRNWLKPSGTIGIPRTFLIRNNKIAWITDPFVLTDEHLQMLVEGKLTAETAKAIVQKNKQ